MKNEHLIPDLDAARRLFEALDQIHLVSIGPEGGPAPYGKDFGVNVEAAIAWATAENGKRRNVYWTVNRARDGVHKKPEKTDMIAARFAHLDVDPPKDGAPWNRAEALAGLQALNPQPSMIIDSGNGLQAFWRLDDGVAPMDIEPINLELIAKQKGDKGTQNCDRLMRVPGFVNFPSAEKRAKGRVPVLSRWVLPDTGELFTLAEIGAAFTPQPALGGGGQNKPRIAKGSGKPSPIEQFNAENTISALLPKYGYTRKGGSDDYRSTHQTSGSFATRDFGDYWVSWSASDIEVGLGVAASGGGCFGDAFDLFVHYEHHDDREAALAAICSDRTPSPSNDDPAQEMEQTLPLADISSWLPGTAKPTAFVLAGLIPEREVTLLTGVGGANKSTALQQLVTCRAAGKRFLGVDLQPGKSLYVTAEDDFDRLQWMHEHICAAIGADPTQLGSKMALSSVRGLTENQLAVVESSGRVVPTQALERLRATIIHTGVDLVALDNVAHLFAGNENDRGQATAFVNLLYSLGVTVVLIGHPNKSGDSYSGSTAWINSVRSQLVIERDELDNELRRLKISKANYSSTDTVIEFRWHDFALWRPSEMPRDVHAEIEAAARTTGENTIFLECLRARAGQGQGRHVGPTPGPTYAPTQFEGMREAKGLKRAALKRAMDRLYAIGAIESYSYRNTDKGRDVTIIRETIL